MVNDTYEHFAQTISKVKELFKMRDTFDFIDEEFAMYFEEFSFDPLCYQHDLFMKPYTKVHIDIEPPMTYYRIDTE